jgi:hypothetical protein
VSGKKPIPQPEKLVKMTAAIRANFISTEPRRLDEEHCRLIEWMLPGQSLEQASLTAGELMGFAEIDEQLPGRVAIALALGREVFRNGPQADNDR